MLAFTHTNYKWKKREETVLLFVKPIDTFLKSFSFHSKGTVLNGARSPMLFQLSKQIGKALQATTVLSFRKKFALANPELRARFSKHVQRPMSHIILNNTPWWVINTQTWPLTAILLFHQRPAGLCVCSENSASKLNHKGSFLVIYQKLNI